MVCLSILFLAPLLWMISTSLKTPEQIFLPYIKWIPNPIAWDNYIKVFDSVNLVQAILNTTFISILNVIGVLISSSLAAYAFSVLKWRFRDLFFYVTLSTMMLPEMVTLVPQFILFQKLGWYGTYLPLIAPSFCGNAFYIFLLRQFFLTIPRELHEAASVDGCSEFSIYKNIYLKLSIPALSVVALFQFLLSWNDLMKPSIYLINQNQYTLSLALQQFKAQHGGTEWALLMAASTIIVLPIVIIFFFAQRTFVQGITMTGIKE
ncbi:MAG: carbohydrate ABC transporter permease [Candidatus Melainabacteria bacterium]|nr:carbohydrate ABC transporter permease [Candidatus Melainabacteria bacterium]